MTNKYATYGSDPTQASAGIANGLRETSGPTNLTAGTINDGEFLKRVGSTLVSAAVGGAQNLSSVLSTGNTTGGHNIILSSGDSLRGAPGSGGVGGNAAIVGGQGDTTFAGGLVTITGGAGGSTSGDGGAITITGGTPTAGNGANVSIIGSAGVGTDKNGGNVILTPGANTGTGTIGIIQVTGSGSEIRLDQVAAVPVTPGASKGAIWVKNTTPTTLIFTDSSGADTTLGSGGGASSLSSVLTVGNTTGGHNIVITSGDAILGAAGSGAVGATVTITGGTGGTTFAGGPIALTGGAGGSTSGAAGGITLTGGTPVDGNGGTITLTASNGVGTNRDGGNIILNPGTNTGSGNIGVVQVTGSGSEIRFDQVAAVPIAPGASKGAIWVKNTTPTTLIFTNSSGADTTLGSGGSGSFTVTNVSGATTLSGNNQVINITAGGFTINLPASPTTGDYFYLKDSGGNAGTSNITISGNGKNIDGASTFVLDVNYMSITVVYNGTLWMIL